ncbi:Protein of unknown function DUF2414 [Kalmanozyma brasiliensis GHG001]|uniref:Uncharacterized protein n=1 Tax=Kalmanozyma brasiliensis (strain GHG001) TaxID=1365824 RepID=V5EYW2_KALBG|nr:Protein of unknown function DUF2414 [Kalmanozyma brasiliensis GHG001]EST08014.1 Protein of unknown function DUF2414 [Kalmanozyma brasiliensis GHG001]
MADVALDYGSAEIDSSAVPMHDDAMEDVSGPTQPTSRFYALPTDQAVEAGAQRGPAPSSGAEPSLDDAALVGDETPSSIPDPPPVESGSDIRLETLLIEGSPITQLSTSRLFAYLTHFGAQPLGLEWIDDQSCKVVFPDERSARLGLEYLVPSTPADAMQDDMPLPNIETLLEYDPDSWHSEYITSLVTPRRAHRVPAKLYTHVERQAALTERSHKEEASTLPDDVPEIYREMEEADRSAKQPREVRDLLKLRGSLWLRHAVTDIDRKENRASTKSQWYKRHGYEAGREIVPKLLQVGEAKEAVELFPDYKPTEGDGRRRELNELDAELDRHVASRDEEPERRAGEMMADAVQARSRGRRNDGDLMDRFSSRDGGRRRGRRDDGERWGHDAYDALSTEDPERSGRRNRDRRPRRSDMEAMDAELEDHRRSRHRDHQRELSPGRREDSDRVRVKGRGRMKAPGFDDRWGGDEGKGSLAKRMGGGNDLLGRLGGGGRLADRFS